MLWSPPQRQGVRHARENGIRRRRTGPHGGRTGDARPRKGLRVVGLTYGGASAELVNAGLVEVRDAVDFATQLAPPRIAFLYIPAGPPVDEWLEKLAGTLQRGDIIVDGGNSYWGDPIRRARRLKERGLS